MSLTHNQVQPFTRQASLQHSVWFGANLISILADGHETQGALAVMEIAGLAGSEPPLHTHRSDDELVHLIDGRLEFTIGQETVRAGRGESVFLPRGIEHTYRVLSGEFHALLFTSPAGLENAFRDISVPAKNLRLNEAQPMPSPIDMINAFGARGIEFRAPNQPKPVTRPNPSLVRRRAIGRSRWYGATLFTPLVTSLESRTFAVVEMVARAGTEPPRHVHGREDELFYVLEGDVTFDVGGDILEAIPGTLVFLPRGVPHSFKITSKVARALIAVTPSGFENYFVEFSSEAASLTQPPEASHPYDLATLAAAGRRYGFALAPTEI